MQAGAAACRSRDEYAGAGPIRLEPSPTVMVLVRVQAAEIRRVRTFSGDCQVDGGGLQVYWLGDANPAQSVEFLKTLVTNDNTPSNPRARCRR